MHVVDCVAYQPIPLKQNQIVCLRITPEQANVLYLLRGIQCFLSIEEAHDWVAINRNPKSALVLSFIKGIGYCLVGYAHF